MKEADLHYVAGMIDRSGSFNIQRSNLWKYVTTSIHHEAIDILERVIGGHAYTCRSTRSATFYTYVENLSPLLPYLRVRDEEVYDYICENLEVRKVMRAKKTSHLRFSLKLVRQDLLAYNADEVIDKDKRRQA